MIGIAVRIEVVLTLVRVVLTVVVHILQLTRNGTDIAAPDVAHGGVDRADSRVGLRRVADHDDRVRERNPRFGKSDRKRNIDAGFDDRDQLRIG